MLKASELVGGVSVSRYDGDGSVSWQVDRGVMDEDRAVGRACDPGHGGGGEHGAIWVRCDARGWWFSGHGGFGRGMRYTGAAYHVVSGRCGGIVGGFECGLGFDDAVGDMFESACITVVVEFRIFGHTSLVP